MMHRSTSPAAWSAHFGQHAFPRGWGNCSSLPWPCRITAEVVRNLSWFLPQNALRDNTQSFVRPIEETAWLACFMRHWTLPPRFAGDLFLPSIASPMNQGISASHCACDPQWSYASWRRHCQRSTADEEPQSASHPTKPLSTEEAIQRLFTRADGDKDGSITVEEFTTVIEQRLGRQSRGAKRAVKVFQTLDADGDGKIAQDDFKRALRRLHALPGPSALDESNSANEADDQTSEVSSLHDQPGVRFHRRHHHHSGRSSANKEARDVFNHLDANRDGVISRREFFRGYAAEGSKRDSSPTSCSDDATRHGRHHKHSLEAAA